MTHTPVISIGDLSLELEDDLVSTADTTPTQQSSDRWYDRLDPWTRLSADEAHLVKCDHPMLAIETNAVADMVANRPVYITNAKHLVKTKLPRLAGVDYDNAVRIIVEQAMEADYQRNVKSAKDRWNAREDRHNSRNLTASVANIERAVTNGGVLGALGRMLFG